ncbi:MAG: hypothetical protein ACO1SV_01625 [Fimbriimonas sp.]
MAEAATTVPVRTEADVVRRSARWVVAGSILAFLLLAFMPHRLAAYAHDALIQLEGAWRLEQGMRIHDGVHTPMGALYPLLLQLGIKLFGPMPRAFLVPVLLSLPFVAWGGWTIFRPRFSSRTAALLTLLLVAVLIGPTCLGDPVQFQENWLRTTFGMQYNRVFWPFATLLATVCLVTRRAPPSPRELRTDGVVAGLLLGLCFFGKVNFFVAGLPVVLTAIWLHRADRRWVAYVAAGFAAVTVVFMLLGVPLLAYLGDLTVLSRAQSLRDRAGQLLILTLVNVAYIVGIAGVMFALRGKGRAWLPYAALGMAGYGILITSANYQEHLIPPLVVALFVLAEHTRRDKGTGRDLRRLTGAVSVTVAVGWIGFTLLSFLPPYAALPALLRNEAVGVTAGAYSPFFRASQVGEGAATERIVRMMDKQARACDRLFGKKARVFRVGWYNVLPVLRQAPSPSGLLWYHDGRTVTRKTLPPPERELKGVDGIVWPTELEETDQLVAEEYKLYISQFFVPMDTDDTATYWRRR